MEPRLPHSAGAQQSPELTAVIDREWDAAMRHWWKAERVPHENLNSIIGDFARRLKVSPKPRFYVTPQFRVVDGGIAPNAMALHFPVPKHYGQIIIANQRMLDLFNYTPHGEIAKPLQATLAHEMAHFQHYPQRQMWVERGAGHMGIGAATTIAALMLMDRFKQSGRHGEAGLSETAQEMREEEIRARGDASAEAPELEKAMKKHDSMLLRGAELLAAAALGVGAMKLSVKHITPRMLHHYEYEADRIAAEMLGDHKPMMESLTKVYDDSIRIVRENPQQFRNISAKDMKELQKDTHPTLIDRLARLEEIGKSLSARRGSVVR